MKGWPNRYLGIMHTIIVHTRTDNTIRGLLAAKNKEYLIIRPASIASTDQNGAIVWSKVDGDVVIPMSNVDFWQEGVEAQLAGLMGEIFEE